MRQTLTDIALRELKIPTLEMRGSDSLDFHEIGVCSLAQALALAYKAGQTAGPVALPDLKQQVAYHVSFIAPAGIYRDVITAETSQEALALARIKADAQAFRAEQFDPVAESYCIREIIIEHPDSDAEQAVWTDPDNFAQLHADEILELLEGMIEVADDLSEAKDALDSRVSDVIAGGESAAIALKTIRREGGAQ
jgi:hypothetical protein